MERQAHGFQFEQQMAEVLGIKLSNKYTSQFDGTYNGIPISIKFEKYGSDIELADYFRNATCCENFYLLVGFYSGVEKELLDCHLLYISHLEWKKLFSDKCSILFKDVLIQVSNSLDDDIKWKRLCKNAKIEWQKQTPNLIRPRFKRDHKYQKRIQCAINNKDFYNYFVPKYSVEGL